MFSPWETDGIVVKINSRKLQLFREKSYRCYPNWVIAINV
jgi:DNA ligase (NAD+)